MRYLTRFLRDLPDWVWVAAILTQSAAAAYVGYALLKATGH